MIAAPIGYCKDCGREWTGLSEAHCSACCSHFTSDKAFDKHLASALSEREVCHDPATLRDRHGRRVLVKAERMSGPAWRVRRDTPHYRSKGEPSISESDDAGSRQLGAT